VILHINDLFDPADLAAAIEAGHVRQQTHPTLPLRILNYSEKAVFERAWNDVTRQCRGLIYDTITGEVTARPLPKFWNLSEPESGTLNLNEPAVVLDKADGSLAIFHRTPDGLEVATRGSFASEQAIHATKLLRTRYGHWSPPDGLTVLAEIIYPANRIVVDYQGLDDLVLLGAVDIKTGRTFGPDAVPDWPGPVVETFPFRTLAEALAAPVRDNREGFVVWFPESDARTKIKYEAYVILHRLVTGLNARGVWEHLGLGGTVEEMCEPLPDEFHAWVTEVADELAAEQRRILDASEAEHERIAGLVEEVDLEDPREARKRYAVHARTSPLRAWLFMLFDGKDPSAKIWRTLQPAADLRPTAYTEEAA
jgi:RNA ligase